MGPRHSRTINARYVDANPATGASTTNGTGVDGDHIYDNTSKFSIASPLDFLRLRKKDSEAEELDQVEEDLREMDWYHGRLTREVAETLLCADGDFLVRQTDIKDKRHFTLSVRWNGDIRHIVLRRTQEGWYCRPKQFFSSIEKLVSFYQGSNTKVLTKWAGRLQRPVENYSWDLTSHNVNLIEKIDQGNFGEVYRGELRSTGEQVAVKKCKVHLPDEYRRAIIEEGKVLGHLRHRHVVRFIGMCFHESTIMMVMEFIPGGSLLRYLQRHKQALTTQELTAMCRDAAEGMAYLEAMKCVHRDLAARNCLLGENNLVKISDFGMSREVKDYYISQHNVPIPIKWTAPEALAMSKYSWMSDVWSYGVLMWEVFSRGEEPYDEMDNLQVFDMVIRGHRMSPPVGMPATMATLMSRCWEADRRQRPHFTEILHTIEDLQARNADLE